MSLEPPAGGIGPRERRWLLIFLVLASAYVGLLLLRVVLDVLGGFSQIILIVFLAWLLAFILSPVVRFLHERLLIPRPTLVALTYSVTLVALGFVLFYTGAAITQQVGELTRTFPQTSLRIQDTLAAWQSALHLGPEVDLVGLYTSAQAQVGGLGRAIFSQAQAIAGVTAAALGSLVLILILSLYMLMDSERLLDKMHRVVPRRYSDELAILETSVARAFAGFLRAQLILGAVQALLVAVIGTLFGMPYLFLVGTLSALAMLIPFFGPPLALIPPVVAAWIYVPQWFLVITVVLVAGQTVVVNWLQPRLMRGALGMHPILVLVGLLIGAQVAGVWGALFGIPVIAVINVFVNYLLESAVPNASLPERERLMDVEDHTLVRVEKEQVGDETHPSIHVHRSLRPDGREEVTLDVEEHPRDAQA